MDDLDGRLSALIAEVRHNPANSRKWRATMHQLLLEIQQLPGIKKSDHQNYPEALNRTFQWVSREIANFEPRPPSVSKSFVNWINGYLGWRIKDLYSPDKDAPISLDAPIAVDAGGASHICKNTSSGSFLLPSSSFLLAPDSWLLTPISSLAAKVRCSRCWGNNSARTIT